MSYPIARKMGGVAVTGAAMEALKAQRGTPRPSAAALLAKPLMPNANELEQTALEEAAHTVIAHEVGASIQHASAVLGRCSFSRLVETPFERAMIAVAGGVARFGSWRVERAVKANNRIEMTQMLSPADLDIIEKALGGLDGQGLEVLQRAATLAGGILAAHSRRVRTLQDALLRSPALGASEIDALIQHADVSPRDPLREGPRLLDLGI